MIVSTGTGGLSEFVPRQYQYKSLEEAFQIISSLLIDMPKYQMTKESNRISNIAKNFSETNYKREKNNIKNKYCRQFRTFLSKI